MSVIRKEENGHSVVIQDEPSGSGESSLEQRGSRLRNSLLCVGLITMELAKQIAAYSSNQFNGGRYPIHVSTIVALIEFLKLLICVYLFTPKRELTSIKLSWKFAVPALIYGTANNLFLFALNFTPPPLWNALIQSRVIMVAVVYGIVFKKGTTLLRALAMFILLLGIALAALSGSTPGLSVQEPVMRILIRAAVLSLVTTLLSTVASVYLEHLLKNTGGTFLEHQIQLYLFGTAMTSVWSLYITRGHPFAVYGRFNIGRGLLVVVTVILCSVSALLVPAIVKKIDNISKLYSSIVAILLTSFLCAWLFPKTFQLTLLFFAAVLIIFLTLLMYERVKPKETSSEKAISLSSGDTLTLDAEKLL